MKPYVCNQKNSYLLVLIFFMLSVPGVSSANKAQGFIDPAVTDPVFTIKSVKESLDITSGQSTLNLSLGNILALKGKANNQSAQAWIRKGDRLRAEGRYNEAVVAYKKARALGAKGDDLNFKIADSYKDGKRKRDAYWELDRVYKSSRNRENKFTACEQREPLKDYRSKTLRAPYFADLYTRGGFQTIGDALFIESKFRWGIKRGEEKPLKLYLFGHITRDNRSGLVGGFPVEYFDNYYRVGVGLEKKLMKDHGLYFVAETGRAHDLVNQGRDRNRDDTRAGFEYYQEFNKDYKCRSKNRRPNRFVMTLSAELKYYTRYDDVWLFQAEARPGIRVYESSKSDVDVFLSLGVYANLDDSNNNYNEVGVGVTWVPNRQRDFKITAKVARIFFDNGTEDTNAVLEFEHSINW